MHSKLGIVILTQNGSLPDETIRTTAHQAFKSNEHDSNIFVQRIKKEERIQTINACLERNLDAMDRFIVLDADILPAASWNRLLEKALTVQADVCCCDPAPNQSRLDSQRNRYVRYLCEQCCFWLFSEKAVQRMRTADTVDLVQEALTDESISVKSVSNEVKAGSRLQKRFLLARHLLDIRLFLHGFAGTSLFGLILFLIFLLRDLFVQHMWNGVCIIGCIVCAHLFLFSVGILLILWYRRSVQLEKKARNHPYVEEVRLQ